MTRNKTKKWDGFTKDSTESSMYIACLNPRGQEDLVKFIYNRGPREVNRSPLISCRTKYLGYAFKIDPSGKSIRDFKTKSLPAPFIEYIDYRLKKRSEKSRKGSYNIFSKQDLDIVEKLFESMWFRQSFFRDSIIKDFHENFHDAYILTDIKTRKIRVHGGSLQCIASIFQIIAKILRTLSFHKEIKRLLPSISDIRANEDFDMFGKRWYDTYFSGEKEINELISTVFVLTGKSFNNCYRFNKLAKNIFNSKYFLCIPEDLLDKLSRIDRVEDTMGVYIQYALRKALETKKRYPIEKLDKLSEI